MTPEKYAQIREIYFRLQEAPRHERQQMLDQVCGSDHVIRSEVESLLRGMTADASRPRASQSFRIILRRRLIVAYGAAFLIILSFALGESIRFKIRSELEQEITDQLRTSVTLSHDVIDSWVKRRTLEIEKLAQDPLIRRSIQKLNSLSRLDEAALALAHAPEQKLLHETMMSRLKSVNYSHYSVWNLNFMVISSDDAVFIGRRVAAEEEVLSSLARLRMGQPNFMPRRRYGSGVGGHPNIVPEHISVVGAPVLGDQGEVVAGLAMALDARDNLDRIIASRRWNTGDLYIFNAQGMLLSEPRNIKDLVKSGLIKSSETPALNLRLLNPGSNLLSGEASYGAKESWPLTFAVGRAIAAGKNQVHGEKSEVLLTPYRDMLGVEVVGAWLWDSTLNFGLVSEIPADKAFFSANAVDAAIRAMYGVTVVLVLFSAGILRRGIGGLSMASRCGSYKLIKRIGEGGLGEVYLAQHQLMRRFAAIKILKADAHHNDCIDLFEREVHATSLLCHPNTVAIYDFGRSTDGRFFYAMEFLSGISLAKLLELETCLPVSRVMHFLVQIIGALKHAHASGFVHRDIKPLNIMVCHVGGKWDVIKVLDFGLVKSLKSEEFGEASKQDKKLYGTPLYLAPECLKDPGTCDVRVDIYSLGVVAYRMLSGKHPFSATHELALMYDALFTEPVPLQQFRPDLDHDLGDLIMRCLAKNPEQRLQSLEELSACLGKLQLKGTWTGEEARNWWAQHADQLEEINPIPLSS